MTKSSRFANDLKTDFKVVTSMAETSRPEHSQVQTNLKVALGTLGLLNIPTKKKSQGFKSGE